MLDTVGRMNPIWLTVLVALLSAFSAWGAQWIAGVRAHRLAALERAARREDRDQELRLDVYAKFLQAALQVKPASIPPISLDTVDSVLATFRDDATRVLVVAPVVADGPMRPVETTAERLLGLVRAGSLTSREVTEARTDFETAFQSLLEALRTDLGRR